MKSILKSKLVLIATILILLITAGIITTVTITGNNGAKTASKQLSLGEKYLSELDYENAVIAFNKVIKLEPRNMQAYLGLAEAYTGLNQPESAIEALETAASAINEAKEETGSIPDNSEDIYIKLAELYEENGESEKALNILKEGYELTASEEIAAMMKKYYPVVEASVPSGSYYEPQTVALSSESGKIYYTLDGSEPTKESKVYAEPLQIDSWDVVLKVVAENEFGGLGEVYTFTYSIENLYGNTNGNCINGSSAAFYKGLIFCDSIDFDQPFGGLISYNIKSGEIKKICDLSNISSIAVLNDRIYCYALDAVTNIMGFYSVKIDGSELKCIYSFNEFTVINEFNVYNGWIYFNYHYEPDFLYKMARLSTDGTKIEELGDNIECFNLYNDKIYYQESIRGNETDYGLYKMNLDGSEKTVIYKNLSISWMIVQDGYAYFHDGSFDVDDGRIASALCRVNLLTGEREILKATYYNDNDLTLENFFDIFYFNMDENWIYCDYTIYDFDDTGSSTVVDKGLYKISIDGKECIKINDDQIFSLMILDDILLYINTDDTDYVHYFVYTDNSQYIRQRLSDLLTVQ